MDIRNFFKSASKGKTASSTNPKPADTDTPTSQSQNKNPNASKTSKLTKADNSKNLKPKASPLKS